MSVLGPDEDVQMTLGVGGSTPEQALARLQNMMAGAEPISEGEYQARIARAQALMRELYADPESAWGGRGRDSLTHMAWRLDAAAAMPLSRI